MLFNTLFAATFLALTSFTVAAPPPGCLLGAVNSYEDPSDVKSVCEAKDASKTIAKMCGDDTKAALSAFADICNTAGVKVCKSKCFYSIRMMGWVREVQMLWSSAHIQRSRVYNLQTHQLTRSFQPPTFPSPPAPLLLHPPPPHPAPTQLPPQAAVSSLCHLVTRPARTRLECPSPLAQRVVRPALRRVARRSLLALRASLRLASWL